MGTRTFIDLNVFFKAGVCPLSVSDPYRMLHSLQTCSTFRIRQIANIDRSLQSVPRLGGAQLPLGYVRTLPAPDSFTFTYSTLDVA